MRNNSDYDIWCAWLTERDWQCSNEQWKRFEQYDDKKDSEKDDKKDLDQQVDTESEQKQKQKQEQVIVKIDFDVIYKRL